MEPMRLAVDVRIPHPRDAVYAVYRDELPQLVAYLPNIRAIEVSSRKDEGQTTDIVNVWHGGGDVPVVARAFLNDAMFVWTDRAAWNNAERRCDWRVEAHAFPGAIQCKGSNWFVVADPKTCVLAIRGEIVIDASRVVPGFLATHVSRALEDFLATRVQANMLATAEGLKRYMQT